EAAGAEPSGQLLGWVVGRVRGRRDPDIVEPTGAAEPLDEQLEHRPAQDRAEDLARHSGRGHPRLDNGDRSHGKKSCLSAADQPRGLDQAGPDPWPTETRTAGGSDNLLSGRCSRKRFVGANWREPPVAARPGQQVVRATQEPPRIPTASLL